MIRVLFRFLKRFAVLLPVLFVGYLSIFNIFPELNEQLPVLFAALITYVLGAYILVPGLIRLVRIVFPPKHLPHYCVTADGFASDPLNIGLLGTRQQVIDAMVGAGWYEAEKLTVRSVIRMAMSTVYKWQYPTGPMSHLYLFGRKQDLAFQLPLADSTAERRHHVRFWQTTEDDGNELWLGAASFDIGVTFVRHNFQFTHLVDPDTNAERDLIVAQLQKTKAGKLVRTIKLTEPYRLMNIHALRGHVETDAQLKVLQLK